MFTFRYYIISNWCRWFWFCSTFNIIRGDLFSFWGPYSGNGATIICKGGQTCIINCYSTGCNNITLSCDNNNGNSCQYLIRCTYAVKSDLCPNGFQLPSHLSLPSLNDYGTNDGVPINVSQLMVNSPTSGNIDDTDSDDSDLCIMDENDVVNIKGEHH